MAVRERWFADGWEFTEGSVRDVEYRSGQLGSPETRGDNGVVPNRPGEVWRPKVHGPGAFTLSVWLGNDQLSAQLAWDTLLRAVARPHRLTEYRRVTPSGESRYCLGEVTGRLEPVAIGQAAYRAEIEVAVPAGYWRGEQLFTYATPLTGAATSRTVDLPDFAVNTAPTTALTYALAGQLVRPRITDITQYGKGESVFYDATIANGGGLLLNSADWSAVGSGGHTANPQALSYTGPGFPSLAALHPATTKHTVQLTADTIGANGRVTVGGYRAYLV